jgi:hypothetical protein
MTETDQPRQPFRSWALVEMKGHRREAGLVTEAAFPAGWIRLDVPRGTDPADGWAATRLIEPAAGYCMTPCTEALAREFASAHQPQPVTEWDLPSQRQALTEPPRHNGPEAYDDDAAPGEEEEAAIGAAPVPPEYPF